jgi:hypothetical protein
VSEEERRRAKKSFPVVMMLGRQMPEGLQDAWHDQIYDSVDKPGTIMVRNRRGIITVSSGMWLFHDLVGSSAVDHYSLDREFRET